MLQRFQVFQNIFFSGSRNEDQFGGGYWSKIGQTSLLGSNAYTLVSDGETLYAIAVFYLGMDGHNR
jgi:hypothetical protein